MKHWTQLGIFMNYAKIHLFKSDGNKATMMELHESNTNVRIDERKKQVVYLRCMGISCTDC